MGINAIWTVIGKGIIFGKQIFFFGKQLMTSGSNVGHRLIRGVDPMLSADKKKGGGPTKIKHFSFGKQLMRND